MKDTFVKKIWISLGVILASVIVAFFALYYFSNDLTVKANAVIADKQKEEQQDSSLGSFALLKSEEPSAVGYLVAINQILPDQYSLIGFTPWLDQVAKKYSVTVSTSLQGNPTLSNGTAPGSINFSLSAQGPTGGVVNFLNDIESQSSGFLLTITSLDYTNDLSGGVSAEKINAQGTLFFR